MYNLQLNSYPRFEDHKENYRNPHSASLEGNQEKYRLVIQLLNDQYSGTNSDNIDKNFNDLKKYVSRNVSPFWRIYVYVEGVGKIPVYGKKYILSFLKNVEKIAENRQLVALIWSAVNDEKKFKEEGVAYNKRNLIKSYLEQLIRIQCTYATGYLFSDHSQSWGFGSVACARGVKSKLIEVIDGIYPGVNVAAYTEASNISATERCRLVSYKLNILSKGLFNKYSQETKKEMIKDLDHDNWNNFKKSLKKEVQNYYAEQEKINHWGLLDEKVKKIY